MIIFASPGGGGHISNAYAIRDYFADVHEDFEFSIEDHWAILGLSYNVWIYNFVLRKNLIGLYEYFIRPTLEFIGFLLQSERWLPKLLAHYFKSLSRKPDLVISNSPILNNVIARAMRIA